MQTKTFIKPIVLGLSWKLAHILLITLFLGMAFACNRKVTRIDTESSVDLSGRWNNKDNAIVSTAMVDAFFDATWLDEHMENYKTRPIVIVGFVINKSHEHIDSEAFVKELEKEIVASRYVRLVQGGSKREAIRAERLDQQANASQSTMKEFGLESGADYMLQGTITSVVDAFKKNKVVEYEVSLEATHLQTNEIVWLDSKKITKMVKN